jgi:ferredoxin
MTADEAYSKLAEMSGKAKSKAFRRILECAITPQEAEFLVALPASHADLAARFKIDENGVEQYIHRLAERGLVTASRKGYRYPRDPGTFHDNILASLPQFIPEGMPQLWMDLYEGEEWWREIAANLEALGSMILRVIPAMRSIPPEVKLLPVESVVEIIQAHKDLISLRRCCCRVGTSGKCGHPIEVCTQFGKRAEYDLYRGSGRKVSVDEAISVALTAETAGLVPNVTNLRQMEALEYICYCCGCSCMCLNPTLRAGNVNKVLAPSRFVVKVDNARCDGCEKCLPPCCFGAITMKTVDSSGTKKAVIDREKCVGCGLCVPLCPPGAMTMEMVRPPEFIPEKIAGPSSIVHQ